MWNFCIYRRELLCAEWMGMIPYLPFDLRIYWNIIDNCRSGNESILQLRQCCSSVTWHEWVRVYFIKKGWEYKEVQIRYKQCKVMRYFKQSERDFYGKWPNMALWWNLLHSEMFGVNKSSKPIAILCQNH